MKREDFFDELGQPTDYAWKVGLRVTVVFAILSWARFILLELGWL